MKPIAEQVVVITGASSGIGRASALAFGARGASVVLAARNREALEHVAAQIEASGGKAHVVVTDVAVWAQVEHLAAETVRRFGRIDTWLNNAAVNEHASVVDMTVEELERIIQVNLMGQIYGVKAALGPMRRQRSGTIINMGSAASDRAVPLHSAYVASKHGIAGFTDSIRLDLAHEKMPITVTLIQPGFLDTPFFHNARAKLGGHQSRPIPPIYAPEVVADTILFAATHPRRNLVVGGQAALAIFLEKLSPGLVDRLMLARGAGFRLQTESKPDDRYDNLFEPTRGIGAVRGTWGEEAIESSFYTRHIEYYPNRKRMLWAALGIGLVALARRR
ncbi:SDR family oxidoreductase [Herbaspirillum sp. SJZ107]|uniref:SDR family oxidoreductase n=1 Tax=Herbaspirillum sp. SJZ107 TaxID=2572881 RepID=UPI00115105B9|nr:SDR family oxidoreductase [Herbaspirillum sp. SJZ107]TQK02835.1 short-subunit dehydrogenase [Herbaspirillum sp. SJZ107]